MDLLTDALSRWSHEVGVMKSVTCGQSVQRLLLLVTLSAVSGWAWPTWHPHGSPLNPQPPGSLHPHPQSESRHQQQQQQHQQQLQLPQLHPHPPSSLLQPQQQQEQSEFYDPYSDTDFSPLPDGQRTADKRTSYRTRQWPFSLSEVVPRSKRTRLSVLGLDNMEYAMSILDRPRGGAGVGGVAGVTGGGVPVAGAEGADEAEGGSKLPPVGRQRLPPIRRPPARQHSSSSSSSTLFGSQGRLSTDLGTASLGRMLQDQRSRRLKQQKEQQELENFMQDMLEYGR